MSTWRIKHTYIALVVLIFSLPVVQMVTRVVHEEGLTGVQVEYPLPSMDGRTLMQGDFQTGLDQWFAQHYGFKGFLVKVNNQLFYDLFRETLNGTMTVGKHDQLFETVYITQYLGRDPRVSSELLDRSVRKVAELQSELKARGKACLLLITPSKAAIYPEYIPDYFHPELKQKNQYELFRPLLDQYGVEYVDGHQILAEMRTRVMDPLFPQYGIHWNATGAYPVVKQLLAKMRALLHRDLGDLTIERMELRNAGNDDLDLASLLNVKKKPGNTQIPQPVFKLVAGPRTYRPTLFMTGGSFNWSLLEDLTQYRLIAAADFAYYYSTLYQYVTGRERQVKGKITSLDWKDQVFNQDLVLLEINEAAIPTFIASGVVEDLLAQLVPAAPRFTVSDPRTVVRSIIGNQERFLIKRGSHGGLFLSTDNLDLDPGATYILTFKARGFPFLECGLDDRRFTKQNFSGISDGLQEYRCEFKTPDYVLVKPKLQFSLEQSEVPMYKDLELSEIRFVRKTKF